MLLRQRGQNGKLAEEISEKLSAESQERLFRIFQDMEGEATANRRKTWMR
jgi:hypothetical protein